MNTTSTITEINITVANDESAIDPDGTMTEEQFGRFKSHYMDILEKAITEEYPEASYEISWGGLTRIYVDATDIADEHAAQHIIGDLLNSSFSDAWDTFVA